jgi:hypothetical protein
VPQLHCPYEDSKKEVFLEKMQRFPDLKKAKQKQWI